MGLSAATPDNDVVDIREVAAAVGCSTGHCSWVITRSMMLFLKAYEKAGLIPKMTRNERLACALRPDVQLAIGNLIRKCHAS